MSELDTEDLWDLDSGDVLDNDNCIRDPDMTTQDIAVVDMSSSEKFKGKALKRNRKSKRTESRDIVVNDGDEREVHNPSDLLSKYINIDVEPYKGTVVDPKDVIALYQARERSLVSVSGRKTSLTPAVFLRILELKEVYHLSDERIADAVGIHIVNFRDWRRRGNKSPDDPGYDQYFALFNWGYRRSCTLLEKKLIGIVDSASETKWEAAKWLLSKIDNGRYGDVVKMDVDSRNENTNTNLNVHANISLTDDEKKQILPMLEDFISTPVIIDNDTS